MEAKWHLNLKMFFNDRILASKVNKILLVDVKDLPPGTTFEQKVCDTLLIVQCSSRSSKTFRSTIDSFLEDLQLCLKILVDKE
ncbi:hypothetical protein B9Q02_00780 [Candidatus Marsarchaeota G1 archaeon BE_D]|jgi:Transcription factor Pcc1.|uniref:Uncharacterized protein n=1 Tax=Candidatus Marsarchaeota G1 archaeon BE_D TaxID=1978156 RepID=A0A2R6AK55_9ARCH|nr:MAG: hypothetical protein B9Q02_00780 [Candidatus Marsarchaeota G1 archaeon BE_D]